MRKVRKFRAAGALGGLTAAVALLAGMPGAHAQGAPGAGSFPGSFLVPGTQTSFRVGGYVKLDYTYDFGPTMNIRGGIDFSSIPLDSTKNSVLGSVPEDPEHRIHGNSQFTASQSRFNIETRTPTLYGEMKTFIEGDFTNPNGLKNSAFFKVFSDSSGFRLRHAYGTLGPFLAGQTWTLFMDLDASVDTLDFGGPPTVFLRQPQVRYTFDFGNGLTLQASAENPQSTFTTQGGGFATTFGRSQGDKIPDFIARANYNAPWGHVSVMGVFRDLYDHNGKTKSTSEFGWGLGLGASLNMSALGASFLGKDQITLELKGGDGIGRYNNSDFPFAGSVEEASNTLKTITSYGGVIGYQHFWTDTLHSNVTVGYVREEFPRGALGSADLAIQQDRLYTGHVNLIWNPVPQVDLGIEYIYGKRRLVDGQSGALNRMQAAAKFKF